MELCTHEEPVSGDGAAGTHANSSAASQGAELSTRGLLQITATQRVHGEKLDAILGLLRQSGGEHQGPSLEELIKALADRMDAQVDYLRIIAGELKRQGAELPGEVAAALSLSTSNGRQPA